MWYKYPKTMHLPWSPGLQNDDRVIENIDDFMPLNIVITEKMDGENATLYRDHYHARSLDSRHHPSRDWIKAFHSQIKHHIPEGWRICGENLYAEHSIYYEDLPSYFMGFSVWNERNECLSWDDTLDIFDIIGITPVRQWAVGSFDDLLIRSRSLIDARIVDGVEGYVVRNVNMFHFDDFKKNVAKYVRKGHIQTDQHWMAKAVVPNKLEEN